jgi:hypothetical protein
MPRDKTQPSSPGSRTFNWTGKGLTLNHKHFIVTKYQIPVTLEKTLLSAKHKYLFQLHKTGITEVLFEFLGAFA